ncbi:MAG: DEAD/DEAH box helicase, partial [Elusimicrobiota bacterium]|nr:DEAD/DEAH box helicase [Elusimicrobiota bacterium]
EKNIQYSDFLKKNCLNTDKKLLKFSGLTKTSSSLIALLTYFHLKNQTKKKSLLYIIDDKIDPYVIKLEIQSFLQLYGINEEVEILELPSKISGDRLLFFEKLLLASKNPKIVIVNSNSLLETTISKLKLESDKFDLKVGDIFEREKLIEKFVEFGFARQEEVYEKQDFSVRGEILDIWALDAENPIRIIFDDNKIEAIYEFDAMTQRRKNKLESNKITLRNFTESSDTIILDYFDKNDFIAFFEEKDIENTKNFLNDKEFVSITIEPFARDSVDLKLYETITFNGNLDFLYKYFEELESNNFSVCVVLYKDSEIQSFKAMLSKKFPKLKINYFSGFLRQGFCSLEKNFIIFTEKELFGRDLIAEFNFSKKEQKKYKNRTKKFENLEGKNLDVFKETSIDYKIGDYVVHNNFGIGRFLGFTQVNTNDKVSEYITIEYAKGDKLFVPIFDFNLISKYSNYESDYVPLLDSMDSFTWQKTRKKVEQKIFEMAMEIISIQATRKKIKGFIFKESKLAEIEFSNTFPYDETEDQKVAIQEVLADMASENPMERLLCGDVGYGKTEVAIRATFRAIMNYKQVVLVCPTTILAKQHFNTFKTRFLNYPVKVVMLSRFLTQKEIAVNKKFIEEGKADIIISTHSVLRSNIKFKNLGFLIVDEEHRFGVKDKEKLKRLQKNLDILYLSATPIPRTLSMALNGIKDISVIETPPPIRKNITTNITEYDEKLIKQMIDFELARNGQVFFVYNRIENIMEKAIEISKLVPKAKIAVVHGRMSTDDLDKIMMDFIDKKYNVLITTTILE